MYYESAEVGRPINTTITVRLTDGEEAQCQFSEMLPLQSDRYESRITHTSLQIGAVKYSGTAPRDTITLANMETTDIKQYLEGYLALRVTADTATVDIWEAGESSALTGYKLTTEWKFISIQTLIDKMTGSSAWWYIGARDHVVESETTEETISDDEVNNE